MGTTSEPIKIGELVKLNLPQLVEHCQVTDPEELFNLASQDYSHEHLGLSWPFFKTAAHVAQDDDHERYWVEAHEVAGVHMRVTSQWYERHHARFLLYLEELGLTPVGVSPSQVDSEVEELTQPKGTAFAPGGSRYKVHAIGNSQNSIIRTILGNLPQESFTAQDWFDVKAAFGNRCAYCDGQRQIVMDHAVPISRKELGEHRLGNLVPACRACNSKKSQKRYDAYLRSAEGCEDPEPRIAAIERHMDHLGYAPLTTTLSAESVGEIRERLEAARTDVLAAAQSAVAAINGLLASRDRKTSLD